MTMTNPPTPSVKDLLAAATPLPWIRPWGSLKVHGLFGDDLFGRGNGPILTRARDAMNAQANLDLAVYAVNHLPDYEAAVDALIQLIDAMSRRGPSEGHYCAWSAEEHKTVEDAREIVARLRGES